MLASSYVDYFCGFLLTRLSGLPREGKELPLLAAGEPRSRGQKAVLALSIGSNLGILGYFKYHDFAVANLDALAVALGLGPLDARALHVALPIGISFYVLRSMSYAIDVYRGRARALLNPVDFQVFVALFPLLVAGPIVRYQTVADPIRQRSFGYEKFARGVAFLSLGLGKKVLLANPMGGVADFCFAADRLHWLDAWYGLVAYAFQIYFDFAGYSDMAVGLGLMLGFAFRKNFDDPYRAESITDFWRRWHISLSTWLREYLYIPLGGNRRGAARTYLNLALVMVLGGLWHGASWSFVLWGALHGAALAAERGAGRRSPWRALPAAARTILTFLVVSLGWVFFRAESLAAAAGYLRSLFAGASPLPAELVAASIRTPYQILVFAVSALLVWTAPQAWDFTQRISSAKAVACMAVFLASIAVLWTQTTNPFLYFQF
jgi:alginate O-acetyltransferase complex protein AlgI